MDRSLAGHGVAVLQIGHMALVLLQPLPVASQVAALAAQLLHLGLQLQGTHVNVSAMLRT